MGFVLGLGNGIVFRQGGSQNWSSYWTTQFRVNSDMTITELIDGTLVPEVMPPCYKFSGGNYAPVGSLLDANEVEIRIKTSSTARMGILGINGMGTIIISGGKILAGTDNVLGNAAVGAYSDNVWHVINVKKTGTANVFEFRLDGILLAQSSSYDYRTSAATVFGGANTSGSSYSLPLEALVNRITLKDAGGNITNEWLFVEGEGSSYTYDRIGDINVLINTLSFVGDADAIDYAHVYNASIILDGTGNIFLYPYKNGAKRSVANVPYAEEIVSSITGILPSGAYWINFNPDGVVNEKLNIFDRSNTTIFNSFARTDYTASTPYVWRISDLDRIKLLSCYNTGYQGKVFVKNKYYNLDRQYAIEEILVTKTNADSSVQTKLLSYTKDINRKIGIDANDNVVLSLETKKSAVLSALSGGLYTRLFVSDALATIFDNHGYKSTMVLRTPADYKNDAATKELLADLQDRGHDIGFWYDESMTLIKLYDNSWEADFLALDQAYQGQYDAYGSPLWGISEFFTISGQRYMALNSQIRHKITDGIIQPVHGTDRIKFTNIPAIPAADALSVMVKMPDDPLIPEGIRGKWLFTTTPVGDEYPMVFYESKTMAQYGVVGTFNNPGSATLETEIGVDVSPVGGPYTAYVRSPNNSNGPNVRARYYTYLHAKLAFEAMGLERPYTVGEPRNISDHDCNSVTPLTELGFISGGVDPVHSGHTFYIPNRHRFNLSTLGGNSETDPMVDYSQAINFNTRTYTAAQAFTKILQTRAKHRFIVERQTTTYNADDLQKWDDLLTLCENNNIPVYTMKEAATLMFDRSLSPHLNVIPPVHVDLDSNGVPDGYDSLVADTSWAVNEAIGNVESSYSYFTRATNGVMFALSYMGGLCPGRNKLTCWMKGKAGDVLSVVISGYKQGYVLDTRPDYTKINLDIGTFTLTLTTTDAWENIVANIPVTIQRNCWFITITASLVKGGTAGDVYCGQMTMSR